MTTRLKIAALLALVLLTAFIDDGPQVAQAAEDAYCERVAAGRHNDYDGLCQEVKP